MKWILSAAVCTSIAFGAYAKQKQPEPPPFDADLFRRDEQVISSHVEFLYWTLEEGALDYALKMKTPAWSTVSNSYAQGDFQTASYNFDPGFRLGLSFFRAPRNWEVKWQYTRMTLHGHDNSGPPNASNEYVTGTWPQIVPLPLTGADSNLHFNYNVAEMLIARVFNPNLHLRLRLSGGAIGTWMSQQWIVRYFDPTNSSRINNKWNYAAGGLKVGTVIDWFWTSDFYITAYGYTGVLMGNYHNHSKQTTTYAVNPGDNTSVPIRNAKLSNIRPSFTMQAAFGPSWQKNFTNTRIEVFAGYEVSLWTNLQELYHSTAGGPSATKETWTTTSTLALQGLTCRVSADY
ncbi:MAG: hypothetical protein JSS32_02505 [Verrucomicrobia bacterium]|nr:hypothetical protein [Verrucomicrobiota bacterium]